ncbi:MAG: O-antigen ligase family protein, partial [Wenzhouxiangella sp.]
FEGRVEGPTNPIYFGGVALIYGLMLVPRVVDDDQRSGLRLLALAAIILAFVANALSGSRGAWLAVPIMVAIYPFTLGRRQRPGWRVGTPLVLLTLSLAALVLPFLPMHERVAETWLELDLIGRGMDSTGPLGLRWQMWQIAVSVIAENPLFGAGPGSFRQALEESVTAGLVDPALLRYDHPHNQYLSALCHFGLPGLAAFLYLIAATGFFAAERLRALARETRFLAWCGIVAVGILAVMGLSESIFERNAGVVWFGLLVALTAGLLGARENPADY